MKPVDMAWRMKLEVINEESEKERVQSLFSARQV